MKKTTQIIVLLSILTFNLSDCFAQYYKYALNINYGLSGVTDPSIQNFSHIGGGFSYEFDETYALQLDFGSDKYRLFNTVLNKEGGVDMFRISLQGVINLSTISDSQRIYDPINVLTHAGFGYSNVKSIVLEGTDKTVNFLGGITPRFRINNNLYFTLDATAIFIFSQHYNFDGNLSYENVVNSFTSITYNLTAGITYRFGEY